MDKKNILNHNEVRDEISLKDKVKLEKYYMDNQSLYLDIKILFLTFNSAFLKSKNISH